MEEILWLLLLAQSSMTPARPGRPPALQPPFIVDGPILQLTGEGASAKALLRVSLPAEVQAADAEAATLSDQGREPEITFTNQGLIREHSDGGEVYFAASATHVPPIGISQKRVASLLVAGVPHVVVYTVSNQVLNGQLGLAISASDWAPSEGPVPIVVTTLGLPATGVRLDAAFTENTTRAPLPAGAVQICGSKNADCRQMSLPAYSTRTLYLRYCGRRSAGVYSGKITLSAIQYGNASPVSLTVYLGDAYSQWTGAFVVVLSVFLSWWVKVWISNRLARDQALLPVAALPSRFQGLGAVLRNLSGQVLCSCPVLTAAVAGWEDGLNISDLENRFGLPGSSPSPFQRPATISADFTTFLTQADTASRVLHVMIDGIQRVYDMALAGQIQGPRVTSTAQAIDGSYQPTMSEREASQVVQNAIDQGQAGPTALCATATDTTVSVGSLLIQIRRLNVAAWLVLLTVAAIGTILTLVLKPGFGKLSDYLLCVATVFGTSTVAGFAIPSQSVSTTVSQAVSGSQPARVGM